MTLAKHVIGNNSLTATITEFGASLTDVRLNGLDHALVLGFPDVEAYEQDCQFMGAVIGRFANRIANGHVPWGEGALALEQNENGATHLHGGSAGFSGQIWTVAHKTPQSITLTHKSPDGEAGYPGTLTATALYEVTGSTLRLTLAATSNEKTLVNLCHHPYFNLDGRTDIDQHRLWISAQHYLPSGADLLPTGQIAPVNGTVYDFTQQAALHPIAYNNTYCLHHRQIGPIRHAATLSGAKVSMDLHTTQPGLHLYNGYKIKPGMSGHGGVPYQPYAGVCLEAQAWPDSPNQPDFPSVTMSAGETITQTTDYKFAILKN